MSKFIGHRLSATEGADGYVAFFTGPNAIAGDNDLFYNRVTGALDLNNHELLNISNIQFDINPSHIHSEGSVHWDDDDKTLHVDTEATGVSLQVGQEMYIRVTNKTGSQISDGYVVYINGAQGNRPTIGLADSDAEATSARTIGITTHDIANNDTGYVTTFGLVRGLDTTGVHVGESWAEGDQLYLSSNAGILTNVETISPEHLVSVAIVVRSNAADGVLFVNVNNGFEVEELHNVLCSSLTGGDILRYEDATSLWKNTTLNLDGYASSSTENQRWTDSSQQRQDLRDAGDGYQQRLQFVNFAVLETVDINVTSDGSTVTFSFQAQGGGDITILQHDGKTAIFDTTPAATISLTAGSDTSPVLNYVYVLNVINVLVVSTSGFPKAGHSPLATVLVQSAAGVQSDGVYKMHAWTDHLSDGYGIGHIEHVNFWIRTQPATWISGAFPTATGGVSAFDVSVSSAQILQLHPHTFPAIDTATSDNVFIVNDSSTPYKKVGGLEGELTDSLGVSMSNRAFFVTIWGVVSEKLSDSKLMCNLPSASYKNAVFAAGDPDGTSVFTIPTAFTGTGFLIARILVTHAVGPGTWAIESIEDLRGQFPSQAAGSLLSSTTSFPDNQFQITDDADNTKIIDFQASAITTGNTRTITMPDSDITLLDAAIEQEHYQQHSGALQTILKDLDGYVTPTSGADQRVAFFTGPTTIAGDSNLYFNSATDTLNLYGDGYITGSLEIDGYAIHNNGFIINRSATPDSTYIDGSQHLVAFTDLAVARTAHLPDAANLEAGHTFIIKDEAGNAGSNNITIKPANANQAIDGATEITIATNYGSQQVYTDGVNWFTI